MIFAMAALAIVAAACSNDDDALIPQQPEHPATVQGIPFTATISGNQTDGITGSILATVLSAQDGTLSAARDVRKGTGTIRVNGTATLSGSTTLAAEYAICKFSVQDLSGTALSVTSLKVSDASGNVITSVTPPQPPARSMCRCLPQRTSHGSRPLAATASPTLPRVRPASPRVRHTSPS